MPQLTLRLDQELADQLKRVAAAAGLSVNRYAGVVLRAAVDPELEGDETERLRGRLARAGVPMVSPSGRGEHVDEDTLRAARRRGAGGRNLAELVVEGRS